MNLKIMALILISFSFGMIVLWIHFLFIQKHKVYVPSISKIKILLRKTFKKADFYDILTYYLQYKVKGYNKLLANVNIPTKDGDITEIDLVYLSPSGIYIFDFIDLKGKICGDENSKKWTKIIEDNKHECYNPIIKNKDNINALDRALNRFQRDVFSSYNVFYGECELNEVKVVSSNVHLLKRNQLLSCIIKDINKRPQVLSNDQISKAYETLKDFSNIDTLKNRHILSY